MKNVILGTLFAISALVIASNIEVGDWELGLVTFFQITLALVFFTNAMATATTK